MSLGDTLNYVLFKNPVSQATLNCLNSVIQTTGIKPKSTMASVPPKPLAQATGVLVPSLARLAGHNYIFVRVAAVSGAAAVALAAYGKHKMKGNEELRSIYESANNMHLVHSVVLLAVPLTRRPVVSGSLFIVGTALFSGTCYYKAIKKSRGESVDGPVSQLAPYGGVCLILGWLSLLL